MGGIAELLAEAERAGMTLRAEGGRLTIRGPKRFAELAGRLLDRKAEVAAVLAPPDGSPATCAVSDESAVSPPPNPSDDSPAWLLPFIERDQRLPAGSLALWPPGWTSWKSIRLPPTRQKRDAATERVF
jgi:hypothetical protein